MLAYAQRADGLGFDSVWAPDHVFYEWPAGVFEPYPEAWTLLTATGVATRRVQLGSLALAAAFRHPAVLAKMAGALQQLSGGRLLLGVGAGNQPAEHAAFGLPFERRVDRLAEYLAILHGLLAGEHVKLRGRYYAVDGSLLVPRATVPLWVAGNGPRMLALAARYASGWDGITGLRGGGEAFRAKLREFRAICQRQGRDPAEIERACSANVLVLPDRSATGALVDHIGAAMGWTPARVRDQYVIGTPDEVVERLLLAAEWGVTHLVCTLGVRMYTLWSDSMLELFAHEVLPRLDGGAGPS
jgi:alkanesulfonate monooxygenase SsuD/methylene tetrahydromethanopterin reductase-like flavin-dependent oxidoreductase (luciferase family)